MAERGIFRCEKLTVFNGTEHELAWEGGKADESEITLEGLDYLTGGRM